MGAYGRETNRGFVPFGDHASSILRIVCCTLESGIEDVHENIHGLNAWPLFTLHAMVRKTDVHKLSTESKVRFVEVLREHAWPMARKMIMLKPIPEAWWLSGNNFCDLLYLPSEASRQTRLWPGAEWRNLMARCHVERPEQAALAGGGDRVIQVILKFLDLLFTWKAFRKRDIDQELLITVSTLGCLPEANDSIHRLCNACLDTWGGKVKRSKGQEMQRLLNKSWPADAAFPQNQYSKCGNVHCAMLGVASRRFQWS